MPGGIRLFLVYALLILAGIGISLRFVIDMAIGAPVSGPGVVVMVLLAYTIFTTTLVIQRKQAGRGLALGLASLTLPLAVYLLLAGSAAAGDLHRRPGGAPVPRPAPSRGSRLAQRGVTAGRPRTAPRHRPSPGRYATLRPIARVHTRASARDPPRAPR